MSSATLIPAEAQDFYAAFGVGPDDKTISTVDANGVALRRSWGLRSRTGSKLTASATSSSA